MAQTTDGYLFPATAEETQDPEFWESWALTVQAKHTDLVDRARKAEQAATDALRQMHEATRQLRNQLDTVANRPAPTDHGPALQALGARVSTLEDAVTTLADAPPAHGDEYNSTLEILNHLTTITRRVTALESPKE